MEVFDYFRYFTWLSAVTFPIPSNSYLWLNSQTFLLCPCCLLAGLLWLGRGPVYTNTHWTSLVFLGDLPVVAEISQPLSWKPIKSPSTSVNTMALSHSQTLLHTLHFSETVSCQTGDPTHPCFMFCKQPGAFFRAQGHSLTYSGPSPAGPFCPAESAHTHGTAAAQKFKLLL